MPSIKTATDARWCGEHQIKATAATYDEFLRADVDI